jgi:tetratricopeptide (TPR) repeat protein
MKLLRPFLLHIVSLFLLLPALAQVKQIMMTAGSPEDQANTEIDKETDAQKKIAMLNDFVQKFASNPTALAFGYSQLAQQYQATGDLKAAMASIDQGLTAEPNALDFAVSGATIAQQAKDTQKTVEYASKGAVIYAGIAKQPKPEGMADDQFASKVASEQQAVRASYEFLEAAAFNAITAEQNPKARMKLVDLYTPAFPKSRFSEQVAEYAIISLQQMNDTAALAEYGEKALAANPDSPAMLVLLARGFSEDQKATRLPQASTYAHRAIELASADKNLDETKRNATVGLAKSVIGYVLLRQEKTAAAIPELKEASGLLKQDAVNYQTVLYRLGYAYAKLNRVAEARTVLAEAINVDGPFKEPARELLQKVNSARTATARR